MLFSITLSSCYLTEKAKGFANVRSHKQDSLEIELPYIVKGRGSLHNFTFEKFENNSANYFYIKNFKNIVKAEELLLVYKKGYSPQSNLKGEIQINDSVMSISLKIPNYSNKGIIKNWTNYKFNGTYILKVPN